MIQVSDMRQQLIQLREEVNKAKSEKSQALRELEEMKWRIFSDRSTSNNQTSSETAHDVLRSELEKAKENERKMLESLKLQTKQLEETKIELEEAKLELRSLREITRASEPTSSPTVKNFTKSLTIDVVRREDNAKMLRTELKLALEAEEKSKKAMDDLAIALKEVTTELNWVKEMLTETRMELAKSREEEECLKKLLKRKEDECYKLKLEAEESFNLWREKENGFIKCMKISEEDIDHVERENSRLIDSQRAAREEISKLRDILKQAINEANVVKEALEIARNENSQLKDLISEKDKAFQGIKQELECLKVSEAAALDSVKELQSLLVATSSIDFGKNTAALDTESPRTPKPPKSEMRVKKKLAKYPSEQWKGEVLCTSRGRRHSFGDSERFEGSIFDMIGTPLEKKDQTLAPGENSSAKCVNFANIYEPEHGWDRLKKKRQILRKFGDMLRRKSFK